MIEHGASSPNLGTYLRQHAPVTPQQAALLAADLADQLADLHARGMAHGPLDGQLRLESVDGRTRPVITGSGQPSGPSGHYSEADDVRAVGVLLADLLGAQTASAAGPPRRPDDAPATLWSLVEACLGEAPEARPTMALLARQLRDAARDLLLGVAPWPSVAAGAVPAANVGGSIVDEIEVPVPGYVPGPDSTARPAGPPRSRRGRRWGIVTAGAATALVLAGVGVAVTIARSSEQDDNKAGTTPLSIATATPAGATTGSTTPAPSTRRTSAERTADAPSSGGERPAVPSQSQGQDEQPAKPKPPPPLLSGGSSLEISNNYARATGSVSWNGTSASAQGTILDTKQLESESWLRIAYRFNVGGTWKVRYASPDPYQSVDNGTSRTFSWSIGGPVKDVQWDLCSKRNGKSYCTGWK